MKNKLNDEFNLNQNKPSPNLKFTKSMKFKSNDSVCEDHISRFRSFSKSKNNLKPLIVSNLPFDHKKKSKINKLDLSFSTLNNNIEAESIYIKQNKLLSLNKEEYKLVLLMTNSDIINNKSLMNSLNKKLTSSVHESSIFIKVFITRIYRIF